ncbi:MAG: SAM-dependent methyltransferase [Akkermansia sp.]
MIRLSDHIASAGGWLSLERFMEIALYDPEEGYYSASIQNVGIRGDFSTTATLSPLLARAIVGEWRKACKEFHKKLPFIEIGAGNAALGVAIQEELGFFGRLGTSYHVVETSSQLRNLQFLALGNRCEVHGTMVKALKSCRGQAFIFSNELVDAFPARIFEQTETGWQEVGVVVKDGQIVEECRPIEHQPHSDVFEYTAPIGQRIEIHESYEKWFFSWLPCWKSGIMTTIDYGDLFENLYIRRPKGSLRGYCHHTLLMGMELYHNVGKCDLTCDVNFSDLQHLVAQCPGDDCQLMTQRDYLMPYAQQSQKEPRVDQYLTSKNGPGDSFKVMIQTRQPMAH